MIITQLQYSLLFLSAFTLVGFLTPLVRKFAISNKIFDLPNSIHKTHTKPIPYLGGVAIILGVITVTYSALLFSKFSINNFWLATSLIAPAFALGLIGLWDDIKGLHPFPRFIGQTISGIVVAIVLVLTENFGTPSGSAPLDILITIFWVVSICNSINFFDNLDGGAAGATAVSAITLAYLAVVSNQNFIAAISIVVAGSTLGFLIWNRPPARIYMGDAGSLFLGVLIATLTIRLKPETNSKFISFSIPLLLLAIPILDTFVALISRVRRKVSPFLGGRDHLSHRLIRAGYSRKITVLMLWLLSILFAIFAILILHLDKEIAKFVIFLPLILWILLLIRFLNTSDE
jgi:UDP-GlcNAc:undecaprenyl-phosphate GlcNAc-1-phosphate transferase